MTGNADCRMPNIECEMRNRKQTNMARCTFLLMVIAALAGMCGCEAKSAARSEGTASVFVMDPSGIRQIVETRDGRTSCWGLEIQLFNELRFAPSIPAEQLAVVESKHNSDCKEMMNWSVSRDGKRLELRFRPGTGDFGSGNYVTVRIAKSAITGLESSRHYAQWDIGTDVK